MESIVECQIYSLNKEKTNDLEYWSENLISIKEFLSQYTKDYLWHYEPLHLYLNEKNHTFAHDDGYYDHHNGKSNSKNKIKRTHQHKLFLASKTRVEESLDDEMFIVYLMKELSDRFKELVISIKNNEGEFLLIEAAGELPKWLNPETSLNRVFIFQGYLHIIPLHPRSPAEIGYIPNIVDDTNNSINIDQALNILKCSTVNTCAPRKLSEAAFRKLPKEDNQFEQHLHEASCLLPANLAYALSQEPQLVSFAVHAFHQRDILSMKQLSNMQHISQDIRKEHFVTTDVTFTRLQYAMLRTAKFYPPKGFPIKIENEQGPEFKSANLGMKLTCGFEMFMADMDRHQEKYQDKEIFIDEKEWHKYKDRLQKLNYFQNEIVGSKLYKELESKSRSSFIESMASKLDQDAFDPFTTSKILLQVSKLKLDEFLEKLPQTNMMENDEGWMHVKPEHLDTEPTITFEDKGSESEEELDFDEFDELDPDDKKDFEDLSNILKGFKTFLGGEGDLDGAMISEEDEDYDLVNNNEAEDEEDENTGIEFDSDRFLKTMQQILGYQETEVPSELKEYQTQDQQPTLEETMEMMDEELYSYEKIVQGFETTLQCSTERPSTPDEKDQSANESTQSVNVDANLLKNLLDSFAAQEGLPGPTSNILGYLGVKLPKLDDFEKHKQN